MAKRTSRLGRLWTRATVPEVPATPAATPADLDTLWRTAYRQALSAGNQPATARRIADDVVRQVKARDNEATS